MAVLRKITQNYLRLTGPVQVALSGSVKNESGSGLARRSIRVFSDESMKNLLGQTYSASDGTWSVTVPGSTTGSFVIVAQSESGENGKIFVNVKKTA